LKIKDRKVVIINQAANYLTIGFANAFYERFENVTLITGSVHVQGEELDKNIKVVKINKWQEYPLRKKMISYFIAMFRMWWILICKYRSHEVVFISVPPMGYLLNLILPQKFSMIIWDVYPDVLKISGVQESNIIYRLWIELNKLSFKNAYKFFTISEVMADIISKYVNNSKIIVQPIWSIFQSSNKIAKDDNFFIKEYKLENKFIVQYSGNIGFGHNVEVLIELAKEMRNHADILFLIIGRGPRKQYLEKMVSDEKLPNCLFLPFQSDENFPFSLSAADLGVVILDERTGNGSVPSKSYNLMSYGIPSLYIASKYSQLKLYVERFNHGQCFEKNELDGVAAFIERLKNEKLYYNELCKNSIIASEHFKRENADKFVERYLE
jgi:glycosyltransferase involved in cell wall biosynthesis